MTGKVGWNLRTKLRYVAPGKQNVCRDSLHGFNNSYLKLKVIVMEWITLT